MSTQDTCTRSVNFETIPDALKEPSQWVLWKKIKRGGDLTKFPFQPGGSPASTTSPRTWSDFETVRATYEPGEFDGIGFVFAEDGPFVGADLDDCFDRDVPTTGASDVVRRLDSYTETSPSGTGLHVICQGFIPHERNRTSDVDGMKEIEIYDDGRYFTVTGEHLDDTPSAPRERAQELYSLCTDLFGTAEKNRGDSSSGTAETPSTLDDRELIEKAKAAGNGSKFTRLWKGDTSGYKSHSEAQQALANMLAFWTGGNKGRMERLFETSGMCRGEDDVRKFSNYDADTALETQEEFYDPEAESSSSSSAPGDETDTDNPGFSVSQFQERLDGLQDKEAERKATDLLDKVATLGRSEIAQCRDILEEHGARVRRLRSFKSDAKAIRKERLEEESSTDPKGPQDLKQGELTAWIADHVLSGNDAFALDGSGALYFYSGGCYHDGGEGYLKRQVKDILDAEGMTREFTEYRCDEVQHRIETDAPELWDDPPKSRINLKNGILNLDTGEFEEHGPRKWLSTRQIPIAHDPEAEGTAWRDALEQWFPDDAGAEVAFEWIAKQITPGYGRRKATYLYGGESKGKSTLLRNLVEGVFGGQGVRHMTLQELSDDDYARANLFDSSLNVCSDLPARPLEGTSVFKRVTGGDTISANRKYKDRFSFTPHCEMIFSGNVPIRAPKAGEPFWDRWLVIPFWGESFEPGDEGHVPEEQLDARLQDPEELSALLNEILRVLPKVQREGVTETQSMADALESIRRHPTNDLSTPGPSRETSQTGGESTPNVTESNAKTRPTEGAPASPERGEQTLEHPEDEIGTELSGDSSTENANSSHQGRGGGYAQDFEKEEGLDTGDPCPKSDTFQSFEPGDSGFQPGDPVKTPGGTGTVKQLRPGSPPKVLVSLDHGPEKRYNPDSLTPKDNMQS